MPNFCLEIYTAYHAELVACNSYHATTYRNFQEIITTVLFILFVLYLYICIVWAALNPKFIHQS